MTNFGKILWWLFIIETFKDGDGHSFIFNKWNPLAMIMFVLVCFYVFFEVGITGLVEEWQCNKLGLTYTQYWKDHFDEIEFDKRF